MGPVYSIWYAAFVVQASLLATSLLLRPTHMWYESRPFKLRPPLFFLLGALVFDTLVFLGEHLDWPRVILFLLSSSLGFALGLILLIVRINDNPGVVVWELNPKFEGSVWDYRLNPTEETRMSKWAYLGDVAAIVLPAGWWFVWVWFTWGEHLLEVISPGSVVYSPLPVALLGLAPAIVALIWPWYCWVLLPGVLYFAGFLLHLETQPPGGSVALVVVLSLWLGTYCILFLLNSMRAVYWAVYWEDILTIGRLRRH